VPADPRFLEFLRDEILVNGPVSFHWFMEQALYHPEFGYYRKDRVRVGVRGDYYTSVSVGPAYGLILAEQIREMHEALGRPAKFTIVEAGAEEGQLAADILSALLAHSAKPFPLFRYVIIEPFPEKQARQKKILERFGPHIEWTEDVESLPAFTGVALASELLDAFPVHLVEFSGDRWDEVCVGWSDSRLRFETLPIENPALVLHLGKLPVPKTVPYRTEINLQSGDWTQSVARRIERGFLLLVDYGFCRSEYYSPQRRNGTLSCYRGHRRTANPLEAPGEMDITAHVDFTTVIESADPECQMIGFADQHHFMVGAGEARLRALENPDGPSPAETKFLRAYKTLMLPGTMGMTFKFLLLSKGIDLCEVSGFRYACEPL
jgi:SAM-dependent MidA family methyltransferase